LGGNGTKRTSPTQVWRDDFNYDGLPDPKKWTFQTDCNKWVHDDEHSEQQRYTAGRLENARVGDGVLRVTARKEEKGGCAFTSARLAARCHCLYGRVEVCARLPPHVRGLWPALWLLPTDSAYGPWPRSGEIDLCENVGWKERGTIHSSVHTAASNHRDRTHRMATTVVDDAHDAFHVYALTWRPHELLISVDGATVHRVEREDSSSNHWPFDKRFFLVLNLAVGGRWGGKMGVEDIDEASLEVAYVRVFRESDSDVD